MRVDPGVNRRKFEREVAVLRQHERELDAWGIQIARADYPEVDMRLSSHWPLKLSIPVSRPAGVALPADLPPDAAFAATIELPMLSAMTIGIRVSLDDFDLRAPSVTFRDSRTWELLKFQAMLRANNIDASGKVFAVLIDDHPNSHHPFVCVRGTREYHEHPQHTGDSWLLYRSGLGLFALVSTIWRVCVEQNRPHLMLLDAPNIRINWEPVVTKG